MRDVPHRMLLVQRRLGSDGTLDAVRDFLISMNRSGRISTMRCTFQRANDVVDISNFV